MWIQHKLLWKSGQETLLPAISKVTFRKQLILDKMTDEIHEDAVQLNNLVPWVIESLFVVACSANRVKKIEVS